MKVLIIDNYDSFTYNLYQYVAELLEDSQSIVDVYRNDEITISKILQKNYDKIIISPGPGHPADPEYFGVCADVIAHLSKDIPTLGVCLGMQGIATVFGGRVVPAKVPMHGKTSKIWHDGKGVFLNLPQNLTTMRYHSLVVEKESLPDCLEITSLSLDTDEIMGLRHKEYPLEGVQFHPESFATEGGMQMLANFLFER
ncbi:MAG: aminodeoxychorismate/anthranilate synthase component II [Leptospiraceae bacterium]|nr:aminodeoxychorismate/anthranilate synthase component II [Leptospiraceae bacterium]MDW7975565.1 aminodeoxychorismate/anthranilate synthase component II [Leptospiraceae bacterium]